MGSQSFSLCLLGSIVFSFEEIGLPLAGTSQLVLPTLWSVPNLRSRHVLPFYPEAVNLSALALG